MVRIVGGGQCCHRRSNGDSDGNRDVGDKYDGRGVGGLSCNVRTRSGPRSRSPQSSNRKSSKGNSASGASTTRSRSGSRSGSGSRLRCMRLREKGAADPGVAAVEAVTKTTGAMKMTGTLGNMARTETETMEGEGVEAAANSMAKLEVRTQV